jgi:riboflavin synthase
MFTGLVQEVGKIKRLQHIGGARRWTIYAPHCMARLKTGDSINIAGACQTVESVSGGLLSGTAIAETLRKTTFEHWKIESLVNLELALRADDRFGGHVVSGHIDTPGRILRRRNTTSSTYLTVSHAVSFDHWSVEQGSIALDGVSLTIAEKTPGTVTVALIPETLKRTTLGTLRVGDEVNIEFDQLVKAAIQHADVATRDSSRINTKLLAASGW